MRLRYYVFVSLVVVAVIAGCIRTRSSSVMAKSAPGVQASGSRPKDNAGCLRCHEGFAKEKISKEHLSQGILCVDCHGPSVEHAKAGTATMRSDILFGRAEVTGLCEGCHENPHSDHVKVTEWVKKREGQVLPSGRKVMASGNICTDCHGEHVMKRGGEGATGNSTESRHESVALFNGRDLTGWVAEGKATWKVENGMLVGTQGPDFAPGDLFTKATYRDFDLSVTYRVVWPANTGIWFRYQGPGKAYQADILEYAKPVAYSGTIYCPGKLFLAINADKELVNQDGWNTLRVRAVGEHLQVWLNGIMVAEAQDSTTDSGRIGFQVHPGKEFGPMKIIVRQVLLEAL